MPEIYVHAVEGRTLDQKRALVKDITDAVVRHFAVPADAVVVQIMESPKTDKALSTPAISFRGLAQTCVTKDSSATAVGAHCPCPAMRD